MSQLERILQRQPHIDEGVLEDIRARSLARLEALSSPTSRDTATAEPPVEAVDPSPVQPEAGLDVLPREQVDEATEPPVVEPGIEPPQPSPVPIVVSGLWDAAPYEPTPIEPDASEPEPEPETVEASELPALVDSEPKPLVPVMAIATPGRPRRPPVKRRAVKPKVVASAYCPYCAVHLDPPPSADRRCTRCRQRIIVRAVHGGVLVLLTEAALEVFDAERNRDAEVERWSRERDAWLRRAAAAGAPASRVDRASRAAPSEGGVEAARALYDATVDQAVDEALRRERWEVAARHRRDQADMLHRLAGRPTPHSDEVRERYQEAGVIELRGIGAMSRHAALIAGRCCDACRADDGTVVRVATELRRARLPHAACAKAPCHCRWDLSPRDVRMIQRYLQRTGQLPEPEPARS